MKHLLTCAITCALTITAAMAPAEAGRRCHSGYNSGVTRSYHFTSAEVVGDYHGGGCGVSGCATTGCGTTGCATTGCGTAGCSTSGCHTASCGTGYHQTCDSGCHHGRVSHKCHKVKHRKVKYRHHGCQTASCGHNGCH